MRTIPMLIAAAVLLVNAPAAAQQHKVKSHLNCRDAVSGEYVTPAYAKKHPDTTVCEKSK